MFIEEKIQKIKLLALDVDGVLSDGKIIIDSNGGEIKNFNVRDGYGLVLLMRMGFKTAIITARASQPVVFRANDLKIHKVYQDCYPKLNAYEQMLKDFGVSDEEVCFVGDDLPDLQVIQRVGFGVAVNNAVEEVKNNADYVTENKGGEGAVREVVELILKSRRLWEQALS